MGNCMQSKHENVLTDSKPNKEEQSSLSNSENIGELSRPNKSVVLKQTLRSLKNTIDRPYVDKENNRLLNIASKGVEVPDDFVPPSFTKNSQERDVIHEAIMSNILFEDLEQSVTDLIIEAMEPFEVSYGTNIITQGETGEYFYVIKSGKVGFFIDNIRVNEGISGQCFGELALLYDCPRYASAISESHKCELWRIDQTLCKQILASQKMAAVSDDMDTLTKVPFLMNLEPRYLRTIAYALQTKEYTTGNTIFTKGEVGHVFYIIKSGTIVLSDIGLGVSELNDRELTAGDFFGERALLTGDVRAATATAKTDCVLMAMNGNDFMKLLGPLEDLMDETINMQYLSEVPIIARAQLQPNELALLVSQRHLEVISFEKDEIIGREGERMTDPGIYIITYGKILVDDNVLIAGDYFCAESLLSSEPNFKHNIKSLGDRDEPTKCIFISLKSFITVVGEQNRLMVRGKSVKKLKIDKDIDKDNFIYSKVELQDLKKIRIIGSGTFGKVWIVKHKESKKALALKVQKKAQILEFKQTESVIREKNIMEMLDHPFIINMISAFQNEDNLFILLKLYNGGELYNRMQHRGMGGMTEEVAKFYAAGVFEALDFMHLRHIIYRDLKPENVVLDSDGYIVIIDMGFAKVVMDKTYTLCGTPLYIAPEIVLSRGHDRAADIWSLGILIYEMNYNYTPFYKAAMDQMDLFRSIVRGKFHFPDTSRPSCNDLISRMLHRRAPFRIGCLKEGAQEIRNHEWFADIDFDALCEKQLPAPWKPQIEDEFDTQNFGDWSALEKEKKRRKKLRSHEQAIFQDFDTR